MQTGEDLARRYAFLVATCPPQTLRGAHEHAFVRLGAADRAALLHAVREESLTGHRLTPELVSHLARLVVAAERRHPGLVLDVVPGPLRRLVHERVVTAVPCDERAYAAWSPPDPQDHGPDHSWDRGWDGIDDNQVYRFTDHSQEVLGGSQAVFTRRKG